MLLLFCLCYECSMRYVLGTGTSSAVQSTFVHVFLTSYSFFASIFSCSITTVVLLHLVTCNVSVL